MQLVNRVMYKLHINFTLNTSFSSIASRHIKVEVVQNQSLRRTQYQEIINVIYKIQKLISSPFSWRPLTKSIELLEQGNLLLLSHRKTKQNKNKKGITNFHNQIIKQPNFNQSAGFMLKKVGTKSFYVKVIQQSYSFQKYYWQIAYIRVFYVFNNRQIARLTIIKFQQLKSVIAFSYLRMISFRKPRCYFQGLSCFLSCSIHGFNF